MSKVKDQGHQGQIRENYCIIPTDNALQPRRLQRVRRTQQRCIRRRDHSMTAGGDGVTAVHAVGGLRAVYVW